MPALISARVWKWGATGCAEDHSRGTGMMSILANLAPSWAQFAGLAALIAVAILFTALGAAVAGRRHFLAGRLIYGWALAIFFITVIGAFTPVSFTAAGLVLVVAASAVIGFHRALGARILPPGGIRVAILALPMLLIVTAMLPSQWDELSQWLPNAAYLFAHDVFPGAGRPEIVSSAPAYPYALPLVVYFASRLAGTLVENAAALFNLLLLLSFALAMAEVAAAGRGGASTGINQDDRGNRGVGWGIAAAGILAVTALNPTFVAKIVFTAYADTGTAVVMGFGALIGWVLLAALAEGDSRRARRLAWQFGLTMIALVNLKQANLALMLLLVIALGLVAWRDPVARLRAFWPLVPMMIGPALIVWFAWRHYVGGHFDAGEFTLRPVGEWFLSLIWPVVERMLLIASKKGGYFGVMLIATAIGIHALIRPRSAFGRLAAITAIVFVGYNLFLLFTYITAFSDYDALRAASYWRYNMHLGGLAILFAVHAVAVLWHQRWGAAAPKAVAGIAIAVVIAVPIALSGKLRFDLVATKTHVREVGADIAASLPAGARAMVIDPLDNGFYAVLMRYLLRDSAPVVGSVSAYHKADGETIRQMLESTGATHAWVHAPTPEAESALAVRMPGGASYLLALSGENWIVLKSWPYPGYERPSDVAD